MILSEPGAAVDLSDGIDLKDVAGLLGMAMGGGSAKSDSGLGSVLGALGSLFKK